MSKRDELEALVKAATDKWGSLDVLVNNAGEARFDLGLTGHLTGMARVLSSASCRGCGG